MSLLHKRRQQRTPSALYNPLDRFFKNDLLDLWNGSVETVPSMNVKEEKDSYHVEMAAPGLNKEDFNIDVDGTMLTISCEKESESKADGENDAYSRREYNYSSFSRSLALPENADPEKISARYTDGVLSLNIRKKAGTEKNNSKKIAVE
jgi:HSP20 family protein